jgi:hypothetical protein
MAPLRNVYYFCRVEFKDAMNQKLGPYHIQRPRWYYEIECVRMYEGDSRIKEYQNKYYSGGHIVKIKYSNPSAPKKEDLDWEKRHIWESHYKWDTRFKYVRADEYFRVASPQDKEMK